MMKKGSIVLTIVAALYLMASAAFADVQFGWANNPANNLTNHLGNPIAAGAATVLTYVSDNTVVNFDYGVPLQLSYGAGSDVFLRAQANASAGRYNAPSVTITTADGGDALVGKYVYAVVLDMPFSTFSALPGGVTGVPIGTRYGVSLIGYTATDNPKAIPLRNPMDLTTAPLYFGGPIQTTLQVIPEPGVAGLAVLGAAVVAIRRYRARQRE